MDWKQLCEDRRVEPLPPSRQERDELRHAVARDLRDARERGRSVLRVPGDEHGRALDLRLRAVEAGGEAGGAQGDLALAPGDLRLGEAGHGDDADAVEE